MRSFKLLLLAFTLFTQATKGQTVVDSLIGKWKFAEVCNTVGFDSTALRITKDIFGDIAFYFKANKNYKASFMGTTEEGSWSIENNKIHLSANKFTENDMDILKITGDTLSISLGEPCFVLTRATPSEEDNIEKIIEIPVLVSATKDQVAKKWFFKDKVKPNRTEEETKIFTTLVKGTYMHFKPNNEYEVEVFTLNEKGTWEFGTDNKSIITTVEKEKKTWSIKSISETELILIKDSDAETWKFSTTE